MHHGVLHERGLELFYYEVLAKCGKQEGKPLGLREINMAACLGSTVPLPSEQKAGGLGL